MSRYVDEVDVVGEAERVQLLDEPRIGHRLAGAGLPVRPLPAADPRVHGLHDVLGVGQNAQKSVVPHGLAAIERLDGFPAGEQLHRLVRYLFFRRKDAASDVACVPLSEKHSDTSHGVALAVVDARAVGVHFCDDRGGGRAGGR